MQLQAESVRTLPFLLEYLSDAGVIPASVLKDCISRLDMGAPAKAPPVEVMAKHVDRATNGSAVLDLYKRYYRPASSLAMHAGALSLLRHVRSDGTLSRRPERAWARRSPVRIADACLGLLTGAIAQHAGRPYQRASRYADRHGERMLTPIAVMTSGGFKRVLRPRQLVTTISQLRSYGNYIRSGEDAQDPDTRRANIRKAIETLLLSMEPEIPPGSLDPFLDYVAAEITSESTPTPT
jgi:hypothetical protein